ncbi:MAG TPA: hypothetical protein VFM46_19655 [Pseudomonadales bacterium]|nr:hypothetical protein [Pseudomonadales bacterium]
MKSTRIALPLSCLLFFSASSFAAPDWQLSEPFVKSMKNGDRHLYRTGEEYVGNWQNNIPNGFGSMTLVNGDKIEGDFVDGLMEGQGKLITADGDVYEGQWHAGKREGEGRMRYANGNEYDGTWRNDKRNGFGTLKYASGSLYAGDWKDDLRHGNGRLEFKSGERYSGEFRNDKKNGQGTIWESNDESFSGLFVNDKKEGVGECVIKAKVQPCAYEGGMPVSGEKLAALLAKHSAAQKNKAQFIQGISYLLERDFNQDRQTRQLENGSWRKSIAMFGAEVKIQAGDNKDKIELTIPEYKGPGIYKLTKEQVNAWVDGDQFYQADGNGVVSVFIDKEEGDRLTGEFTFPVLKPSAKSGTIVLRNGKFDLKREKL